MAKAVPVLNASIGAEPVRLQVVTPYEILFRFLHQLSEGILTRREIETWSW
jgi:hypothetical protein